MHSADHVRGQAGEKTIANALGEPTAPRHTETVLVSKGLLTITPNGRLLTEADVERTITLLTERGLLEGTDVDELIVCSACGLMVTLADPGDPEPWVHDEHQEFADHTGEVTL